MRRDSRAKVRLPVPRRKARLCTSCGGPQEQQGSRQALADPQPGQALGQLKAALPPRACHTSSVVAGAEPLRTSNV